MELVWVEVVPWARVVLVCLLAHITGIHKLLDFPGYSGPVVSGTNPIIGFTVASMHRFSDGVMHFHHDFDMQVPWDAQACVPYGVFEVYQSIFRVVILLKGKILIPLFSLIFKHLTKVWIASICILPILNLSTLNLDCHGKRPQGLVRYSYFSPTV